MRVVVVNDLMFLVEAHGDEALATEQASRPKPFIQDIQVPHAVEKRQDYRVRPNCRPEGRNRAFQVIGLAAQQHQIEGLTEVFSQNGRWLGKSRVAEAAPNGYTRAGQFGGAPRANKEGRIPICLQQSAAKIAADRAGADDENSHYCSPPLASLSSKLTARIYG